MDRLDHRHRRQRTLSWIRLVCTSVRVTLSHIEYVPYNGGSLFCEGWIWRPLRAAHTCYVYRRNRFSMRTGPTTPLSAMSTLVCYAVKANSTLAVLSLLARRLRLRHRLVVSFFAYFGPAANLARRLLGVGKTTGEIELPCAAASTISIANPKPSSWRLMHRRKLGSCALFAARESGCGCVTHPYIAPVCATTNLHRHRRGARCV